MLGRVKQITRHSLIFNQARKNAKSSAIFANESIFVATLITHIIYKFKKVEMIGEEEQWNERDLSG